MIHKECTQEGLSLCSPVREQAGPILGFSQENICHVTEPWERRSCQDSAEITLVMRPQWPGALPTRAHHAGGSQTMQSPRPIGSRRGPPPPGKSASWAGQVPAHSHNVLLWVPRNPKNAVDLRRASLTTLLPGGQEARRVLHGKALLFLSHSQLLPPQSQQWRWLPSQQQLRAREHLLCASTACAHPLSGSPLS